MTVKRLWKRNEDSDLEAELRAGRPEPRADFVHALSARVREDGRRSPRPSFRIALAGAMTGLVLVALAAGGGFQQATSAVNAVLVKASDRQGAKPVPESPGQDQYKPGKGCGDQNHIHDRRHQCKARVSDASVREGNSGTTSMTFTVSLSDSPLSIVTVGYSTANGTATAGSDYSATAGTLVFGIGQTSQTISVPVTGDTTPEPNETVFLNLTSVSANALIEDGQGVGTILNDDKK